MPISVNSREEFSLWCCRLHNEVNEKLGYESTHSECDLAALDLRWKVGRKACWDADDWFSMGLMVDDGLWVKEEERIVVEEAVGGRFI